MKIFVTFLCNDNSGNASGHIDAFEIIADDQIILIEDMYSKVKYSRQNRIIAGCIRQCVQIGKTITPLTGYKFWVGNICWDGAHIGLADAAKIINYLRSCGFTVDTAETRLFKAYNSGEKITAAMLRKVMHPVAG